MRLPKLILLIVIIAAGCSNSKTGSSENADSTSVSSTAAQEEIKLTPQEMERLREELFHYFRESETYVSSPLNYVQHEHFVLYDKGFTYIASYSPAKNDLNDDLNGLVVTGDIDSVTLEGNYRIISASKRPEGGIRSVTLLYTGRRMTWEWEYQGVAYNAYEYSRYGATDAAEQGYEMAHRDATIYERSVTLSIEEPRIYSNKDMYLKMRITTISDKDLSGLSKDELRVLRNEVFARHGHTFKTPEMIAYFDKKSWYKPYVDDATPFLNDIEKKNVEFIKAKEQG